MTQTAVSHPDLCSVSWHSTTDAEADKLPVSGQYNKSHLLWRPLPDLGVSWNKKEKNNLKSRNNDTKILSRCQCFAGLSIISSRTVISEISEWGFRNHLLCSSALGCVASPQRKKFHLQDKRNLSGAAFIDALRLCMSVCESQLLSWYIDELCCI